MRWKKIQYSEILRTSNLFNQNHLFQWRFFLERYGDSVIGVKRFIFFFQCDQCLPLIICINFLINTSQRWQTDLEIENKFCHEICFILLTQTECCELIKRCKFKKEKPNSFPIFTVDDYRRYTFIWRQVSNEWREKSNCDRNDMQRVWEKERERERKMYIIVKITI